MTAARATGVGFHVVGPQRMAGQRWIYGSSAGHREIQHRHERGEGGGEIRGIREIFAQVPGPGVRRTLSRSDARDQGGLIGMMTRKPAQEPECPVYLAGCQQRVGSKHRVERVSASQSGDGRRVVGAEEDFVCNDVVTALRKNALRRLDSERRFPSPLQRQHLDASQAGVATRAPHFRQCRQRPCWVAGLQVGAGTKGPPDRACRTGRSGGEEYVARRRPTVPTKVLLRDRSRRIVGGIVRQHLQQQVEFGVGQRHGQRGTT